MIGKYIAKVGKRIIGDDELRVFFDILESSNVKKSIIFLNEDCVLYYRKLDDSVSVMIKSNRKNIGALKFYEKVIVKNIIRFKFDALDEIFNLAKEIEEMSFEEFIKFMRKGV